jgi:hypothetical protein
MADLSPVVSMLAGFAGGMAIAGWPRRRRGSKPAPPGRKPAPPAGPGPALTEGRVQRGQGNGGPTTPKPPIKPQPTGGRMVSWPW